MKYFYEKSDIVNFDTNITYHELLSLSSTEFDDWVDRLRELVVDQWDNKGIPPVIGKDEDDIVDSFMKLRGYDVNSFLIEDPDDSESCGVVKNFNKDASSVNQFFPTMLKTRISIGKSTEGATSIYDHFSLPELKDRFKKAMLRSVKKDSMYSYSKSLTSYPDKNDVHYNGESGIEWVRLFSKNKATLFRGYGIWLCKVRKSSIGKYDYPTLDCLSIEQLQKEGVITDIMVTNIDTLSDGESLSSGKLVEYTYLIRYYKKSQRLFPAALQVFRLGLGQPAVNFPPLTAKFLYEKYTSHIEQETITIYDPSSGWGGRILGAMSTGRNVHYVGTDPNMDNYIDELGMSRYEYLAKFYNDNCIDNHGESFKKFFDPAVSGNTFDIFSEGSEVIQYNDDFKQYRGKVDFIFTSPPYFNREQYSDDDSQSYKMFAQYEDWRDGFLRPTLETAYEWLRDDRFLIWNIADIQIGKNVYYPLEQDSIDILTGLGMKHQGKLKMLMTRMVGLDPKNVKNSWYHPIEQKYYKYEPLLIFKKEKDNEVT